MKTELNQKSTTEQIRKRFDGDVERFSHLETGQSATVDAPLAMELIARAAIAATPGMRNVLDIGCGAGNNSIRLLTEIGLDVDCDLCDLSEPMLIRHKSGSPLRQPESFVRFRVIYGIYRFLRKAMMSFWRRRFCIISVTMKIGRPPSAKSSHCSGRAAHCGSPI